MTALKDSLEKLQDGLETALGEVKTIRKSIEKLESAFVGEMSRTTPRAQKRGSATKLVLQVIENSPKAISLDEIKSQTGLEGKSIYAIFKMGSTCPT